ncbi:phosphoribosylamine--glycine ligase [Thermoplasmatales archaeon BRNA1]|nr:phosphoribosylamine--glycine ligase [Thermoplasmatales archaeon BRNA1]
MKVLTIGGGAREHAAVEALARAGAEIYAVMKNVNPGIEKRATKTLISSENDIDKICDFAINNFIEYAFVGPEAPLSVGIVDALQDLGIKCASPTKAAARIETNKSFMRELVQKYEIEGNLGFRSFDDAASAIDYVKTVPYEVAVKPVGLTGGKGVKVQGDQLKDLQDTIDYINEIFDGNVGGGKVIIEEKAEGEEFTQMVFTDGSDVIPMPLVQDHKRAYEGDTGPNTGGMGSYSDSNHLLPFIGEEDRQKAIDIVKAIIDALKKEGCPYRGTMYGQFMLTKNGPKIIEINARFGDPEAMNVLTVLSSDFSEIIKWMAGGGRIKGDVTFAPKATVCKYIVPRGYGVKPEPGHTISFDMEAIEREGSIVYFGSIDKNGDKFVTGTSRSVGVVGIGDSISEAEANCESGLSHIKCDAMEVRHDIGTAALIQKRIDHMRAIRGQ